MQHNFQHRTLYIFILTSYTSLDLWWWQCYLSTGWHILWSCSTCPFVSASNFLTVHFISDGTVQRRGFNATYSTTDSKIELYVLMLLSLQVWITHAKMLFFTLGLCGGAFNATASSQTITSPYYPNAYPPFASCRWVLDAPSQEVVKVSVQQFHLDSSQSCTSNFLEFIDFPVVRLNQ